MTTPQDPSGTGSSQPPRWDAPPAWGSPAEGYGPPPGYGPAPQGYGQPPAHGGGYGGPQQTSSRAIIALVLAIGSFVVFPLIPAIIALVMAPGARDEIHASGGRLGGEGLLTAAKVVAWINIGLSVVGVLAVVALFGLFVGV